MSFDSEKRHDDLVADADSDSIVEKPGLKSTFGGILLWNRRRC